MQQNYIDPVFRVGLIVPRHAIGPRQIVRAGEIWRLYQETAVQASIHAGWSPSRYREEGTGFVVGAMTVSHNRELQGDQQVEARSWIRDFRRGVLCRRQVELWDSVGCVSQATQSWVHVGGSNGVFEPCRAPASLIDAFPVHPNPGSGVCLPAWESSKECVLPEFDLAVWYGWMDPLGHANHPAYIDWCDESIYRALIVHGIDPTKLVAVAEQVRWRIAAMAGDQLVVRSRGLGLAVNGYVIQHELVNRTHGGLHATAFTVRRLIDDETGSHLAQVLAG